MSNKLSGRAWAFPPHLDDRSQITMVEDDANIRQSIFVVINTIPGERVMRPHYGCRIHELIFWPANHNTAGIAARFVTEALERFEARIELHGVEVEAHHYADADAPGSLEIKIYYSHKDRHDVRSLVYPFYLIPS